MTEYLSYDEYVNMGGTLDLTAFNRNIARVYGIIENATQGRIDGLYGIPREVKLLCLELVEYLAEIGKADRTAQSKSQSAGGVSESVTYADDAAVRSYIDRMLDDYLRSLKTRNGVSVLYKGAMY